MKHFKLFSSLKAVVCIAALWGGLCSCSGLDGIFSDDEDENDSSSKASSFTGKYTEPTTGTVTFYEGYNATSVAYYVPQIENGFYKCAVSEPKLAELPPGTALEITYNGTTINALITDLCPSSENSEWTSQSSYFFDLAKNAFTKLAEEKLGHIDVTFKAIPYPTKSNIFFQAKDGINEWWLAGRFYNIRYPLKKVEISIDGSAYKQMDRLSTQNNWYEIKGENLTSGKKKFRLTDVYGQVIETSEISSVSAMGKYDCGKNFEY